MIQVTCDCERKIHSAPVEGYEISAGAIKKIPELLKNYNRIYMVADENTYAAAGAQVEEVLRANGMFYHRLIITGSPILPNAETIGKIVLNAVDLNAKSDTFFFKVSSGNNSKLLFNTSGVISEAAICANVS